jgi:hypothetical protein
MPIPWPDESLDSIRRALAYEALLPAAQGSRGAAEQQAGGLATEALLPVGRANRGAMEGLLRTNVESRMLVMWHGIDRRHRVCGSMSAAQFADWAIEARTSRCTEELDRLRCSW